MKYLNVLGPWLTGEFQSLILEWRILYPSIVHVWYIPIWNYTFTYIYIQLYLYSFPIPPYHWIGLIPFYSTKLKVCSDTNRGLSYGVYGGTVATVKGAQSWCHMSHRVLHSALLGHVSQVTIKSLQIFHKMVIFRRFSAPCTGCHRGTPLCTFNCGYSMGRYRDLHMSLIFSWCCSPYIHSTHCYPASQHSSLKH